MLSFKMKFSSFEQQHSLIPSQPTIKINLHSLLFEDCYQKRPIMKSQYKNSLKASSVGASYTRWSHHKNP